MRAAAEDYARAGFAVCRIPDGEKNPMDKGWTTRSTDPAVFEDGFGIGIVGGIASRRTVDGVEGYPVCVDIDARKALELADQYLPPTQAMEGRPGKPNSHRWYLVMGVPATAESRAPQVSELATREGRFAGPVKKQFRHKDTDEVLIDFIGSGGQAVVPPSFHAKSGTHRAWAEGHGIEKAAVVPFVVLWDAVNALAVAAGGEPSDLLLDPAAVRLGKRKTESSRTPTGDRVRPRKVGGGGRFTRPPGTGNRSPWLSVPSGAADTSRRSRRRTCPAAVTRQRVWLAVLIGDWPAAHEAAVGGGCPDLTALTSDRAGESRDHRLRGLLRALGDDRLAADAIVGLGDLEADAVTPGLEVALGGQVSGVTSAALDVIERLDDPAWCPRVYSLFRRVDPGGQYPGPSIWTVPVR